MNILIIGESCVDEYIFGHCDRVCPEAAALCFTSTGDVKTNLGMAGNVYANLKSLRPDYNIDIVTNVNSSIIKRRFVDTRYNTIVFRHDINDKCDRINIDLYSYKDYNAIIFSDYCKGFLQEQDISDIVKRIPSNCITFIDTKKKISDFIRGITFLKINNKEFKENVQDLSKIRALCNIIVTKGDGGATHINSESETSYPTKKIDIRDVCGAGDTFMAGFVIKFLETRSVSTSIDYANKCSASVVSKFGVCVP